MEIGKTYPLASPEDAEAGWTLNYDFLCGIIKQVREQGVDISQEDAEAVLMAATAATK